MKNTKALRFIGFLALALGLLTGCGSDLPGGLGGRGGGRTVTVVADPSADLSAYYQVGNGDWQPLDLTGGEASFEADRYTIVARCHQKDHLGKEVGPVILIDGTAEKLPRVSLGCPSSGATEHLTFDVTVPATLGGVAVQDGDRVYAANGSGEVQGLKASFGADVEPGTYGFYLSLLRVTSDGSGNPTSTTPIGWAKRVRLPSETQVIVKDGAWQPFAEVRAIQASPPAGYVGSATVAFVAAGTGVKTAAVPVGMLNAYGVTGESGTYLGIATYAKGGIDATYTLTQLKTLAGDWRVELPPELDASQVRYDGVYKTISFPGLEGASSYLVSGMLMSNISNGARIQLYALFTEPKTDYLLPTVQALDVTPEASATSLTVTAYLGVDPSQATLAGELKPEEGFFDIRTSSVRVY